MERQIKKSLATVLRHRVDVQTETRTGDGQGGYTAGWATASANVPAAIDPIQARQQFINASVGVDATHVFKMRADVTVAETQRILWGSRVFEILTIENINENGELLFITTKERR
jgi:SPP1 family predicted phage head-tail adaptor